MHKNHRGYHIYVLVLVGGKGKRLRPLSTQRRPKAFLSITKDGKTMFRLTIERICKIFPSQNILVSANKQHRRLVILDFPELKEENLILEPVSRNTAPAIGLCALKLKQRWSDAIMIVIPSDQYIINNKAYYLTLKKAIQFIKKTNCVLCLGLTPYYPATGFGYMKLKKRLQGYRDIYEIEKFVEKPDIETAKKFMMDKRYLWNGGMFVFPANLILNLMRRHVPDIYTGIKKYVSGGSQEAYYSLPDISIDYAIMERIKKIYCIKGHFRWYDIGSFENLKRILLKESRNFIEKNGKIVKILEH